MMGLHLLFGVIVLLSAIDESTSSTSITLLDCGGIKFQHEFYTQSELPVAVEDTDMTFLIPWIEPSQVRELGLSDYGIGAYVKKSYAVGESSETLIGHAFSQGNSQIYVPRESDNPGGFARLFFENYLLNTARRYRIIVLSLPEDSHSNMSNDSLHTLLRFMSLPAESSEVNLIFVGGEEALTKQRLHDSDHHANYIRNVIKSCKECSLVSVKRWTMNVGEASKNFPGVPYATSELGSLLQVLQQGENAKNQHMRSLACLQLDNIGNSMNRNQGTYYGNIEGLHPHVPVTPKDVYPHGQYTHIKPKQKEMPSIDMIVESELPNHNEKGLLDALDGLAPLEQTRSNSLRKPGEVPVIMFKPYEKCEGNILLIYGDYFPLEIKGHGCEYRTVLVRSTVGIQVISDISLPGKNLIFHTSEVLAYGDYTIDLTGDNCNREYGGNFIMLTKTFYGMPLKVVTNGGKDCDSGYTYVKRGHNTLWTIEQGSGLSDVARSEVPAEGMDLVPSESRMIGEGRRSHGKMWHRKTIKGKLKSIELEKGFSTSLSQRDLIQLFAGHVINDHSMNGTKIIQQAQILINLGTGDDGASRRMYDPLNDPQPFHPPPYVGPIDIGNVELRSFRDSNEDWCFVVKVDDYEIECAIDFRSSRPNEQSLDLARKLRDHSVAVEKCFQVNLPYVTEYDLFLCNLTVLDLGLERNYIKMDDGLTCYYDTIFGRKALTCRVPKNVTDGDGLTRHVLDIAWAILTMRHMIVNPLNMIRVSLRNFEHNPSNLKLFSQLHDLYNGTYRNLLRDLHHFYEDALIPKATDLLYDFGVKLNAGDSLPSEKDVADIICWIAFIRSKILADPPRSQIFPLIFKNLVYGNLDPSVLDTIHNSLTEKVFNDFPSFKHYLNFIRGKAVNYPEELRESLTEIVDRYYKIAENQTHRFSSRTLLVKMVDEEKIKLSEELLKIMKDFRDEVLELRHSFDEETLIFFLRTAGKFVDRQNDLIQVFNNAAVISIKETPSEYLMRFPMEYVYRLGTECKSFNLDLGLKIAFNKTKSYPNELYITILENLEKQRKALEELPDLSQFGKGIKAYARTTLDLEREVYRSFQTVARVEDIKTALDKVQNFDGDAETVKPELQTILDVMHWTLSYLIFKSAVIDFEQRIFPFWEDTTPLFHPENIAQSLKELAKSEEGFLRNFKPINFDPKNNTKSETSFFTWDASVIGQKYLYDFFRGYYPLYLLARTEGEYPTPVKGYRFAVKFLPKANYTGNWLKRIKGTEVHIRPASFSYNFYDSKTYYSCSKSPRFNQVIGVESSGLAAIPVSPYSLWRVRVRKIRVDFPETVIDKIELIGDGLILDQKPEPPPGGTTWEPNETYDDIHFTLPKRIIASNQDLG